MSPEAATGPTLPSAEAKHNIVLAGLSIFDEIGGLQKFNQRLVQAVTARKGSTRGATTVISFRDKVARKLIHPDEYLPCSGDRLRFLVLFIRTLWRHRPAVILLAHVKLAPLSVVARLLLPRATSVLFVHGIEVWNSPTSRRIPWFERFIVRHCVNSVVAVSQFTETIMRKEYRLPSMCFRRLHNAIELDLEPVPRADQIRGKRHILSVTRLDESYKGVGHAVCAVAILRSRLPDINYTIVGSGALIGEIAALIKALGVDDIVNLRGALSDSDLAEAYQSASLFVLPSRKEGFGIVFLEAWKHGLPVICGNTDASPEVVTHGASGLAVDPDDVIGLAAAIETVLGDPELARRMVAVGRESILTKFSDKIFRETVQSILDDLVSAHPKVAAL